MINLFPFSSTNDKPCINLKNTKCFQNLTTALKECLQKIDLKRNKRKTDLRDGRDYDDEISI